jgi:hypothetical protein
VSPSRRAEKQLEKLRASTAEWSPAALAQILEGYGFTRKKEARHGTFFEHPSYPEWATVIIPRHRSLKNWVARQVLEKVERLIETEEKEGRHHEA